MLDERDPVHVLHVEVARERLQRLDRLGRVLPDEGDADGPRAGFHVDARAQPLVEGVFRQREVGVRQLVVFVAAHRRREDALAVDTDLEHMGPLEPGHVADDVLQQIDAEVVVGIEREVVVNHDAAARAERQAVDVVGLGAIRRNTVHSAHGRDVRIADREARDLARRRQVLFEQRGRDLQDVGDVVEPVRLIVGREKGSRVDVEREQVADGVGVLGPVQAVERRPAWVGFRESRAIDRGFEKRDEGLDAGLVRTRRAERRHHAAAQLSDDFLPGLGPSRDAVEIHLVEHQASRLDPLVVTRDAIPGHQCARRRSGR